MDDTRPRGQLITFEGTEGSGKSTQIRILAEWLEHSGRSVRLVREPGGTPVSERIREVLLDPGVAAVSPWAEFCLYAASRAQLVQEVIRPALKSGAVVLADRFADASVAYQGIGRALGAERVRQLNDWVTGGLIPDVTFLFDLDPETGLERARKSRPGRLDRIESEPMEFHRTVRQAYLDEAALNPDRFVVLDAAQPQDVLTRLLEGELERRLS